MHNVLGNAFCYLTWSRGDVGQLFLENMLTWDDPLVGLTRSVTKDSFKISFKESL